MAIVLLSETTSPGAAEVERRP